MALRLSGSSSPHRHAGSALGSGSPSSTPDVFEQHYASCWVLLHFFMPGRPKLGVMCPRIANTTSSVRCYTAPSLTCPSKAHLENHGLAAARVSTVSLLFCGHSPTLCILSVFMLFCSPSCFTAHGNRSCVLNAGSMSAFKRRRAQFETPQCPSCDSTNVVTDNRQGHLVCDDCGVILESSMISTATEYRNFSESDKPTGTLDAPHHELACCLLTGSQYSSPANNPGRRREHDNCFRRRTSRLQAAKPLDLHFKQCLPVLLHTQTMEQKLDRNQNTAQFKYSIRVESSKVDKWGTVS